MPTVRRLLLPMLSLVSLAGPACLSLSSHQTARSLPTEEAPGAATPAQPAAPPEAPAPVPAPAAVSASPRPTPATLTGAAPPGGFLAPADLAVGPATLPDAQQRLGDWITVRGTPEAERVPMYGTIDRLAGGLVHVVFANGAGVKVHLEGAANIGIVVRNAEGTRIIYPYDEVEWVRATR